MNFKKTNKQFQQTKTHLLHEQTSWTRVKKKALKLSEQKNTEYIMKGSKGDDRAGELEENMLLQWFFYILCCTIILVNTEMAAGMRVGGLVLLMEPTTDFQALRPYQEEIEEHLKQAFNVNTLFSYLLLETWKPIRRKWLKIFLPCSITGIISGPWNQILEICPSK